MTELPESERNSQIINKQIASFNSSEFAQLLGMEIIEAYDGYARVVMDTTGMKNPYGVAHGGAVFAVADQAFGIAANCSGVKRVAVSVHMQYISPASDRLIAIAHRIADNGTYSTFRVLVYEGERTVAQFEGVAFNVDSSGSIQSDVKK